MQLLDVDGSASGGLEVSCDVESSWECSMGCGSVIMQLLDVDGSASGGLEVSCDVESSLDI
jgi:hypothetical protein